jgi:hypothetical protein
MRVNELNVSEVDGRRTRQEFIQKSLYRNQSSVELMTNGDWCWLGREEHNTIQCKYVGRGLKTTWCWNWPPESYYKQSSKSNIGGKKNKSIGQKIINVYNLNILLLFLLLFFIIKLWEMKIIINIENSPPLKWVIYFTVQSK